LSKDTGLTDPLLACQSFRVWSVDIFRIKEKAAHEQPFPGDDMIG